MEERDMDQKASLGDKDIFNYNPQEEIHFMLERPPSLRPSYTHTL